MMNVLVLGGTGNIGSAIVEKLVAMGASVSVLCRNDKSTLKAEKMGVNAVAGDISCTENWISMASKFNSIVHVACGFQREMGTIERHLCEAIKEVIEQSRRRVKFVYTGGVWCFGSSSQVITEVSGRHPIEEFAWMLENSKILLDSKYLETVVVHPSNVVSKENFSVPPVLTTEFAETNILRVPVSVSNRWPLVDRLNLADFYCLALEHGKKGEEYIAADEPGVRLDKLISKIPGSSSTEREIEECPISYWLQKYGDWANGYSLNQVVSTTRAEVELGFQPSSLI